MILSVLLKREFYFSMNFCKLKKIWKSTCLYWQYFLYELISQTKLIVLHCFYWITFLMLSLKNVFLHILEMLISWLKWIYNFVRNIKKKIFTLGRKIDFEVEMQKIKYICAGTKSVIMKPFLLPVTVILWTGNTTFTSCIYFLRIYLKNSFFGQRF